MFGVLGYFLEHVRMAWDAVRRGGPMSLWNPYTLRLYLFADVTHVMACWVMR